MRRMPPGWNRNVCRNAAWMGYVAVTKTSLMVKPKWSLFPRSIRSIQRGISLQRSKWMRIFHAYGDDIQSYYQRLGVVVLGTVTDGDCGVDCACQMLGLGSNSEARDQLRKDFHFFFFFVFPHHSADPTSGPFPKNHSAGTPPF